MKNLIYAFALVAAVSLAPRIARAELPQIPDNVSSADICMYHTFRGLLTCRDSAGNALVRNQRIFKEFRWTAYPALPVLTAMRHLGFESQKFSQVSDDVTIVFARPLSCR